MNSPKSQNIDKHVSFLLYEEEDKKDINNLKDLTTTTTNDKTTDLKASFMSVGSSNLKRSFAERWFSKIHPDSLRGNIFNLSIISMGTGCLALPCKFANMSMLAGIVAIFLIGAASFWTLYLLLISSQKEKVFDYTQLVKKTFGKFLSKYLDFTIFIYILGQLCVYQVILYQMIGGTVYDIGNYASVTKGDDELYPKIEDFLEKSFWNNYGVKYPIMFGFSVIVLFPLCIIKNLSKLRFTSMFGVIVFFILILILIVQCPFYIENYWINIYDENDPQTFMNFYNVEKGFDSKLHFFKGAGTLFYAYACHFGAFPVMKNLSNATSQRLEKVFKRSIMLDTGIYLVVGIIGFLAVPTHTPDLILSRYPVFRHDYFITAGKILFFFVLVFKFPVHFNAQRLAFFRLCYGKDDFSRVKNIIFTLVIVLTTCSVSLLYTGVGDYLAILGGVCAVPMCFFIPCLVYLKTSDHPKTHWKIIGTWILAIIMLICGIISATITIIDVVAKLSGKK